MQATAAREKGMMHYVIGCRQSRGPRTSGLWLGFGRERWRPLRPKNTHPATKWHPVRVTRRRDGRTVLPGHSAGRPGRSRHPQETCTPRRHCLI
ncbi:hypothetical protein CLV72_103645 [Allonocardiopsis opalescens]|uniref:Uncharacterized protein n=1 Tax=Allonocardiopsis opalescens TaxID=1144618 RepID=A0A2T0Q878_9ACTN|nr:hypothetical protein CLV72_103645 [Allonocardiopsis opalescens]